MTESHTDIAKWYLDLLGVQRKEKPDAENLRDPEAVAAAENYLKKIAGEGQPPIDAFRELTGGAILATPQLKAKFLSLAEVLFPLVPAPAMWVKPNKAFGCTAPIAFMDALAILKLVSGGATLKAAREERHVENGLTLACGIQTATAAASQQSDTPQAEGKTLTDSMKRAIKALMENSSIDTEMLRRRYGLTAKETRMCRAEARRENEERVRAAAIPTRPGSAPGKTGTFKTPARRLAPLMRSPSRR